MSGLIISYLQSLVGGGSELIIDELVEVMVLTEGGPVLLHIPLTASV